ncbi:MAG: hypothetical protein P8J20_00830 [Novosphingobium sp.]|nr:hypothetical protein [Novosphingobium sp.]
MADPRRQKRKLDRKINDDFSTLKENASKRRSEAFYASTDAADLQARLDRINRIEALIKERLENERLENARESWAISAAESDIKGRLDIQKIVKARAKAKLERLKNSRPGQSDILTTQPGKNLGPRRHLSPKQRW